MSAPAASWASVLDAFEARLDAVRDALAMGDPASVPPFAPPADLGPLPGDQVARATVLLRRAREVEQVLHDAREATRARLDAPAPVRRATAAGSRLDLAV